MVDINRSEVARVSFHLIVSLLEKAKGLSHPYLGSRVDYPWAVSVYRGLLLPGSTKFVISVTRSNVRVASSGRSLLDKVIPVSPPRGVSSWEMALPGDGVRGSGWVIRDVLDVLPGRVNRYYSLKEDAEKALGAVRANVVALTARNTSLREENGEWRHHAMLDLLVKCRRVSEG